MSRTSTNLEMKVRLWCCSKWTLNLAFFFVSETRIQLWPDNCLIQSWGSKNCLTKFKLQFSSVRKLVRTFADKPYSWNKPESLFSLVNYRTTTVSLIWSAQRRLTGQLAQLFFWGPMRVEGLNLQNLVRKLFARVQKLENSGLVCSYSIREQLVDKVPKMTSL